MYCSDCFRGAVHEGQPRGRTIKLHGVDVYVSEPSQEKPARGIIVIIHDIMGWQFVNNRILADRYADKSNYKVYLPDFMNGHAPPRWALESVQSALSSHSYLTMILHILLAVWGFIPLVIYNRISQSAPFVRGFFEQLRKDEGETLPIGAAGFCWGGKHTVLLGHGPTINGKLLIDAGFTGHPSLLALPQDIEKIILPVSFAIGDKDNAISMKQAGTIASILEAKQGHAKGEVKIYENAGHGFCARADIKFKDVEKQATDAEDQCISWFNQHLKIKG